MISIIGSGGHCISLISNFFYKKKINAIYDIKSLSKKKILSINLKKLNLNKIKKKEFLYIAIGNNLIRKKIYNSLKKKKIKVKNCISKNATIIHPNKISNGNQIFSNVYIGPETIIGENNIINTGSIIEHEVIIGSHCNINPGSTVCGKVSIGNNVVVGAGSVVFENIHICDNVIIGGGTVVNKSITKPGIYYGSPAKFIRHD